MKKTSYLKKFILIFLVLHTAVTVLFAYLVLRGGVLPDGSFAAISLALFSALITAYTAYRISRLVSQEIAAATETVRRLSAHLKAMSERLYNNAKAVESRAVLVSTCANTITELVKDMDSLDYNK